MRCLIPCLTTRKSRTAKSLLQIAAFAIFIFSGCRKADQLKPISTSLATSTSMSVADVRPNIVFILGDDIGHDVPTVYGGGSYETPNIDLMAQQGMKFNHMYSSPLCSPSRVAIMTGKYNFRNYDEWGVLDPTAKTFGNLLKDAGYATFVAGKWQLDGGDAGVHSFGFDGYSLWNPIKDGVKIGEHYKNPTVYENAAFLPKNATNGRYGDDIFTNRVLNFINDNKDNKFFAYFPITLCHSNFSPTPDNPDFAAYDPRGNTSDPAYFPSMAKYMDKLIGQVIQKLKDVGVYDNTVVIFIGDNGTPSEIYSLYNGQLVQGGKSKSTEAGTNVPCLITWPGHITPGAINDNLVEFQDILPTLGDMAGVSVPVSYGITDGQSFYQQLIGGNYTPRDWVFNHYQPNTNSGNNVLLRWTQDKTYKLYDSTGANKFFNVVLDPDERFPIKKKDMTPFEKQRVKTFQQVMAAMHN